ncbi:MAG TPA: DUF4340 domain-containing protein [Victivallales bacterium]|nr:DUF4340 domain-containing protein [Victivallales bacterium]HPO89882.1 DUF4340 domain-containing protein [Victivallales bacterium]HRR29364.1 DUF4340 domain-containing protein [Victivallales bacterium]HRU01043.1 DUF4340 domain-containing protein [Victivallales bacterium]
MKPKNLFLLIVIAAVLITSFFLLRQKELKKLAYDQEKIGMPVLKGIELDNLNNLKIFSGKDLKVELKKNQDSWNVVNLYDYPASPSKLRSLTVDLLEMKVLRNISAQESQFAKFGLDIENPSFSPVRVELNSENAKIAEFIAGKKYEREISQNFNAPFSEGRYLLVGKSKNIILCDKTLYYLENEASDWIDKEFFSAGKVKKAELLENEKILWKLIRNEENEDMKLENLPEGREADSSKISEVSSALSYLNFTKIADPKTPDEKSGLNNPKIFNAEDFDGIKYIFKIGNKEGSDYYTKVSAEFIGIEKKQLPENEKTEEKEKKEKEFAEKEKKSKEKVEQINKKYSSWLYLFPEYKIKTLTMPLDELLKKVEEKTEEKAADKKEETEEQK